MFPSVREMNTDATYTNNVDLIYALVTQALESLTEDISQMTQAVVMDDHL